MDCKTKIKRDYRVYYYYVKLYKYFSNNSK